jgi:opacity protein-like surface antigen
MKRIIVFAAIVLGAIAPNGARAQWSVGPHILVSFPKSDFANVSETGGGFGIKVARKMRSLGGVGLRGDFAFLSYGRDLTTVNFGGIPILAEVRHDAFRLTFGPQFVFGTRSLKAHVGALGGFYFFRTNINLDQFNTISSENDAALGWNAGGGLMYDIGLGPWLDVAVEYQTIYNATTEFPDPNNQNQSLKRDITAHEITLKVGVTFFLK